MKQNATRWLRTLSFNKKKQQHFLEDLASLLTDGVSLKDSITTLNTCAKGVTQDVTSSILESLSKGMSLANGMESWFPIAAVEIIRTGETSGTLSDAVLSASTALAQKNLVSSSLIMSFAYPAIVLIVALIVLVVVKQSVLENFATIKPISQWPSNGVTLYQMARFVEYWWWMVLLLSVTSGIIFYKFLHDYTGALRQSLDKLPLISFYRDAIAARFMQTLGSLIQNGIMLKKALKILENEAEPYLARHIMLMEHHLSGGVDNIANILETHLLRESDLLRLKVIAKGKGFAPALVSLGNHAANRNKQSAILTGKVFGALLLVGGAAIAANIILGIYAIGNALAH